MKRKPRPQSAKKRLAILDAAARAISRRGFHGMSMRDVAREAGQVVAGLYNYFPSKNDLLFEIQRSAFETMIATAQDALHGLGSPRDRLFAFIYQHVRYVAEHPDVMRVLVHEAAALEKRDRSRIRALKEKYTALGRDIVAELYQGPDLERVTYGIFGMLNWVYGWYEPSRHGTPGEVARSLHRIALGGLSGGYSARGASEIEERLANVTPLPLLRGNP